MDPSSNNLCNVIVGGTTFTFSKTSFEQPHMNDTIIKTTVLGVHNNRVPYFEVDPDVFKKWLAPYIRHNGMLPEKEDLKSPTERKHLIHAANTCGLIALAQYVESDIPKQLNAMQVTKITIYFGIDCGDLFIFDYIQAPFNHKLGDIACPDKSCNVYFQKFTSPSSILYHLINSHNGTTTLIYTGFNNEQKGFIKCEMKEYERLVAFPQDERYIKLVHPE